MHWRMVLFVFPSLVLFYFLLEIECVNLVLDASGKGTATDIVVSSVKAYIGALNKMLGYKEEQSTVVSGDCACVP